MALNPSTGQIVVLVGGVGGAKLAQGLTQIIPPDHLTIIVNTGDDFEHHGLTICPDLDTVMYTLAGWVDPVNGWGIAGDTTTTLEALGRYGVETWFRLGDRDIATHLIRSEALRTGERLTTITERLSAAAGIAPRILPMSDDPVRTMIDTVEHGEIAFQTYFVKYRWQPTVRALRYAGAAESHMTPEVRAAIESADAILIAPSNPFLSVAPILSVEDGALGALIRTRPVPRVALTPIVAGRAVKGPAAKLMGEFGHPVTPGAVAAYYGDLLTDFVYDTRDLPIPNGVVEGVRLEQTDTLMHSLEERVRVARSLLDSIDRSVNDPRETAR